MGSDMSEELKNNQIKTKKTLIDTLISIEGYIGDIEKKYGLLPVLSPSKTDTWDIDARDTLRDITSLGYGELGQSNLESLMRGLRARDGNR